MVVTLSVALWSITIKIFDHLTFVRSFMTQGRRCHASEIWAHTHLAGEVRLPKEGAFAVAQLIMLHSLHTVSSTWGQGKMLTGMACDELHREAVGARLFTGKARCARLWCDWQVLAVCATWKLRRWTSQDYMFESQELAYSARGEFSWACIN